MKTKQLKQDILAHSLRKQSEESSNYGKVRKIIYCQKKPKKFRTSQCLMTSYLVYLSYYIGVLKIY